MWFLCAFSFLSFHSNRCLLGDVGAEGASMYDAPAGASMYDAPAGASMYDAPAPGASMYDEPAPSGGDGGGFNFIAGDGEPLLSPYTLICMARFSV